MYILKSKDGFLATAASRTDTSATHEGRCCTRELLHGRLLLRLLLGMALLATTTALLLASAAMACISACCSS
jgi:hypothetical protein